MIWLDLFCLYPIKGRRERLHDYISKKMYVILLFVKTLLDPNKKESASDDIFYGSHYQSVLLADKNASLTAT